MATLTQTGLKTEGVKTQPGRMQVNEGVKTQPGRMQVNEGVKTQPGRMQVNEGVKTQPGRMQVNEGVKTQPGRMQVKPKSAPGSRPALQSRLAKTQSDAMKEMQAWARRAEEPGASCPLTRMSGHLSDNVTEERMLRAKLWELSKERYKFLLQNAYEKKLFADRMQRKTQAMLRARANSAATLRSSTRAGKPRPFTTSALTHHTRPFPSSTHCSSRPFSTSQTSQVRLLNTAKTPQTVPLSTPQPSQVRQLSEGRAPQMGQLATSIRDPGHVVTSSSNEEEGLRPGRPPESCSENDPESSSRPEAMVMGGAEHVAPARADLVDPRDNATSEVRDRMREVERGWVMSRGRGKVTPAATSISLPPPAVVLEGEGEGEDTAGMAAPPPKSPAAGTSKDNSQAHPPSPPPPASAFRNVQFSKFRAWRSAKTPATVQAQTQADPSGHSLSTPGSTSLLPPGVPSSSQPGTSSKPTSASSKRSAPWSPSSALSTTFLSRRRALLHRYGARLESKTSDPRYASLEHSLIPVPHPPVHPDVSSIVQNFDALRVRPKVRKEVKTKTGYKALTYINERGFVF